ncbi:MAG: hypothetical protein COA55_01450 [Alcanivorax sp.]|nr:MAG: hypothetical protein COA55_01450 [Alcanivorax sp.]
MDLTTNAPKDTKLSKIGSIYNGLGGEALMAFLTALNPALAPAAMIGGLLNLAYTERSQYKLDFLLGSIESRLQDARDRIDQIDENLEEALEFAAQGVKTATSKEKIERFAKIISGHVIDGSSWDETATALRTLTGLEDVHIEVLSAASQISDVKSGGRGSFYINDPKSHLRNTSAKTYDDVLSGSIGMAESRAGNDFLSHHYKETVKPDILEFLRDRSATEVTLFCNEMMAKGLLHDNDQGDFSEGPVFTLTSAAYWFLAKIEIISREEV